MDITEKLKQAYNANDSFRYKCTEVVAKGKRFVLITSSGFRWYTHSVTKSTWLVYPVQKGVPGTFVLTLPE